MNRRPASYHTKQGEAILDYMIKNRSEYVTAIQIFEYFKSIRCHVSRTTIYRRLESLTKDGKIRKYLFDGNTAFCYQYVGQSQKKAYHLKCDSCGEIFLMECNTVDHVSTHIFENHAFRVNNNKTVFYGKCEVCLRN
ncbi:MAG: transcriptional repressor [Lachnoclostridium sp.]|jgi:Fur family ferric uptake transcriptional regulator|nr:transcriptional repressor [Lachnoclostridium sp.]